MSAEIVQVVEVFGEDGAPLQDLCKKLRFSEEHLQMSKDRFAALMAGDGRAKVRREIGETIGGPGYSSVRVSTSIEICCDQNSAAIQKAAEAIYQECVYLNEDGVLQAYEGLLNHRDTLKLG